MKIPVVSNNLSPTEGNCALDVRDYSDSDSAGKAKLLAVCPYAVIAFIACIVIPSLALAGSSGEPLASVISKAEAVQQAVVKIGRTLFIIAGIFLGYRWTKGSHEARERTEHYIVGLVIGLGVIEIVNWFSS